MDELPFGNFVEIEGSIDGIREVMQQIDLQNAKQYSANYIMLFDHVKTHLGLNFNDLTFGNFQGIQVPESAFEAV
jgi:adenylate cyclase class 2